MGYVDPDLDRFIRAITGDFIAKTDAPALWEAEGVFRNLGDRLERAVGLIRASQNRLVLHGRARRGVETSLERANNLLLNGAADVVRELANRLRKLGTDVQYAFLQVIFAAIELFLAFVFAIWMAAVWPGASSAVWTWFAARAAMFRVLNIAWVRFVISAIIAAAILEGLFEAAISVAIQLIQRLMGTRDGFDWELVRDDFIAGLIIGATGAGIGVFALPFALQHAIQNRVARWISDHLFGAAHGGLTELIGGAFVNHLHGGGWDWNGHNFVSGVIGNALPQVGHDIGNQTNADTPRTPSPDRQGLPTRETPEVAPTTVGPPPVSLPPPAMPTRTPPPQTNTVAPATAPTLTPRPATPAPVQVSPPATITPTSIAQTSQLPAQAPAQPSAGQPSAGRATPAVPPSETGPATSASRSAPAPATVEADAARSTAGQSAGDRFLSRGDDQAGPLGNEPFRDADGGDFVGSDPDPAITAASDSAAASTGTMTATAPPSDIDPLVAAAEASPPPNDQTDGQTIDTTDSVVATLDTETPPPAVTPIDHAGATDADGSEHPSPVGEHGSSTSTTGPPAADGTDPAQPASSGTPSSADAPVRPVHPALLDLKAMQDLVTHLTPAASTVADGTTLATCLALLRQFAQLLYGTGPNQGIRTTGTHDDLKIGTGHPTELGHPDDLSPVSSWQTIRDAVAAKRGRAALFTYGRTNMDTGHAGAIVNPGDGNGPYYVHLTGSPGLEPMPAGKRYPPFAGGFLEAPVSMSAILIEPDGRAVHNPWRNPPESSSLARPLIDAVTSRGYSGALLSTPTPTDDPESTQQPTIALAAVPPIIGPTAVADADNDTATPTTIPTTNSTLTETEGPAETLPAGQATPPAGAATPLSLPTTPAVTSSSEQSSLPPTPTAARADTPTPPHDEPAVSSAPIARSETGEHPTATALSHELDVAAAQLSTTPSLAAHDGPIDLSEDPHSALLPDAEAHIHSDAAAAVVSSDVAVAEAADVDQPSNRAPEPSPAERPHTPLTPTVESSAEPVPSEPNEWVVIHSLPFGSCLFEAILASAAAQGVRLAAEVDVASQDPVSSLRAFAADRVRTQGHTWDLPDYMAPSLPSLIIDVLSRAQTTRQRILGEPGSQLLAAAPEMIAELESAVATAGRLLDEARDLSAEVAAGLPDSRSVVKQRQFLLTLQTFADQHLNPGERVLVGLLREMGAHVAQRELIAIGMLRVELWDTPIGDNLPYWLAHALDVDLRIAQDAAHVADGLLALRDRPKLWIRRINNNHYDGLWPTSAVPTAGSPAVVGLPSQEPPMVPDQPVGNGQGEQDTSGHAAVKVSPAPAEEPPARAPESPNATQPDSSTSTRHPGTSSPEPPDPVVQPSPRPLDAAQPTPLPWYIEEGALGAFEVQNVEVFDPDKVDIELVTSASSGPDDIPEPTMRRELAALVQQQLELTQALQPDDRRDRWRSLLLYGHTDLIHGQLVWLQFTPTSPTAFTPPKSAVRRFTVAFGQTATTTGQSTSRSVGKALELEFINGADFPNAFGGVVAAIGVEPTSRITGGRSTGTSVSQAHMSGRVHFVKRSRWADAGVTVTAWAGARNWSVSLPVAGRGARVRLTISAPMEFRDTATAGETWFRYDGSGRPVPVSATAQERPAPPALVENRVRSAGNPTYQPVLNAISIGQAIGRLHAELDGWQTKKGHSIWRDRGRLVKLARSLTESVINEQSLRLRFRRTGTGIDLQTLQVDRGWLRRLGITVESQLELATLQPLGSTSDEVTIRDDVGYLEQRALDVGRDSSLSLSIVGSGRAFRAERHPPNAPSIKEGIYFSGGLGGTGSVGYEREIEASRARAHQNHTVLNQRDRQRRYRIEANLNIKIWSDDTSIAPLQMMGTKVTGELGLPLDQSMEFERDLLSLDSATLGYDLTHVRFPVLSNLPFAPAVVSPRPTGDYADLVWQAETGAIPGATVQVPGAHRIPPIVEGLLLDHPAVERATNEGPEWPGVRLAILEAFGPAALEADPDRLKFGVSTVVTINGITIQIVLDTHDRRFHSVEVSGSDYRLNVRNTDKSSGDVVLDDAFNIQLTLGGGFSTTFPNGLRAQWVNITGGGSRSLRARGRTLGASTTKYLRAELPWQKSVRFGYDIDLRVHFRVLDQRRIRPTEYVDQHHDIVAPVQRLTLVPQRIADHVRALPWLLRRTFAPIDMPPVGSIATVPAAPLPNALSLGDTGVAGIYPFFQAMTDLRNLVVALYADEFDLGANWASDPLNLAGFANFALPTWLGANFAGMTSRNGHVEQFALNAGHGVVLVGIRLEISRDGTGDPMHTDGRGKSFPGIELESYANSSASTAMEARRISGLTGNATALGLYGKVSRGSTNALDRVIAELSDRVGYTPAASFNGAATATTERGGGPITITRATYTDDVQLLYPDRIRFTVTLSRPGARPTRSRAFTVSDALALLIDSSARQRLLALAGPMPVPRPPTGPLPLQAPAPSAPLAGLLTSVSHMERITAPDLPAELDSLLDQLSVPPRHRPDIEAHIDALALEAQQYELFTSGVIEVFYLPPTDALAGPTGGLTGSAVGVLNQLPDGFVGPGDLLVVRIRGRHLGVPNVSPRRGTTLSLRTEYAGEVTESLATATSWSFSPIEFKARLAGGSQSRFDTSFAFQREGGHHGRMGNVVAAKSIFRMDEVRAAEVSQSGALFIELYRIPLSSIVPVSSFGGAAVDAGRVSLRHLGSLVSSGRLAQPQAQAPETRDAHRTVTASTRRLAPQALATGSDADLPGTASQPAGGAVHARPSSGWLTALTPGLSTSTQTVTGRRLLDTPPFTTYLGGGRAERSALALAAWRPEHPRPAPLNAIIQGDGGFQPNHIDRYDVFALAVRAALAGPAAQLPSLDTVEAPSLRSVEDVWLASSVTAARLRSQLALLLRHQFGIPGLPVAVGLNIVGVRAVSQPTLDGAPDAGQLSFLGTGRAYSQNERYPSAASSAELTPRSYDFAIGGARSRDTDPKRIGMHPGISVEQSRAHNRAYKSVEVDERNVGRDAEQNYYYVYDVDLIIHQHAPTDQHVSRPQDHQSTPQTGLTWLLSQFGWNNQSQMLVVPLGYTLFGTSPRTADEVSAEIRRLHSPS